MVYYYAPWTFQVKEARAGDIVAIVGLKDTTTGDTQLALRPRPDSPTMS